MRLELELSHHFAEPHLLLLLPLLLLPLYLKLLPLPQPLLVIAHSLFSMLQLFHAAQVESLFDIR
jgi:hypothetical protein